MNTRTFLKSSGVAALAAYLTFGAQIRAVQAIDPGVRGAPTDGGIPLPLPGLTSDELTFFQDGLARFQTVEAVSGAAPTQGNGLGPRFNSDQCSSCHSQPYVGGSSPASNPLIGVASADGAANAVPWFITSNGPVREARFVESNGSPDGSVHALFVITNRADAGSCNITQPNFLPAGNPVTGQGGNRNVVFRIPTPLLGAGLIESIPDSAILTNMAGNRSTKQRFGVSGHPNALLGGTVNRSANDGTITRFGWKAQNKSLLMFSGEAYNVEMGISNTLFPQERDETPSCQGGIPVPNDANNFSASSATAVLSDAEAFADFARLLAPPTPAAPTAHTQAGLTVFSRVGCALCHTPTMRTAPAVASGGGNGASAALSNQPVSLFSDLLVHHMGSGLADGITQGAAGPDEFRTAPLWGLGERVYFLHDGRTSNLLQAIEIHKSPGSEANQTVASFDALSQQDKQALIDFLRSL
jgi:CxxC motif-containing protein (DUF1111 family)